MSQENVEMVRGTIDALDRRDYQRAVRGIHTDAVWHDTGEFPRAHLRGLASHR